MLFREVQAEDGRWARPLLEAGAPESCEYAFANVYMWREVFKTTIGRMEDLVLVRGEGEKTLHYLWPAGRGDVAAAVEAMLADAQALGKTAIFYSLDNAQREWLEGYMPGAFVFDAPRGEYDYLYLVTDLAELPGKRFQKKRNHCARFERAYPDWGFYEMGPDTLDAVCAFNQRWAGLYGNRGDEGIADEQQAVHMALSQWQELGLQGGYITTGGEIVAFSFGSEMGDMFVTHVEKALYDVPGAYNIINREMARRFGVGHRSINRENDVGEEGLRAAKLSYHPAKLVPKITAARKEA